MRNAHKLEWIPRRTRPYHHKMIWDFSVQPRNAWPKNITPRMLKSPIEIIYYRNLREKESTCDKLEIARKGLSACKRISKFPNSMIYDSKMNFSKTTKTFFSTVGELLVENEGGIYMKDFAYFSIEKMLPQEWEEEGGESIYCLKMYSDFLSRKSPVRDMIMDRAFHKDVKKELSEVLKNKIPKYNYLTLIKDQHDRK